MQKGKAGEKGGRRGGKRAGARRAEKSRALGKGTFLENKILETDFKGTGLGIKRGGPLTKMEKNSHFAV